MMKEILEIIGRDAKSFVIDCVGFTFVLACGVALYFLLACLV